MYECIAAHTYTHNHTLATNIKLDNFCPIPSNNQKPRKVIVIIKFVKNKIYNIIGIWMKKRVRGTKKKMIFTCFYYCEAIRELILLQDNLSKIILCIVKLHIWRAVKWIPTWYWFKTQKFLTVWRLNCQNINTF